MDSLLKPLISFTLRLWLGVWLLVWLSTLMPAHAIGVSVVLSSEHPSYSTVAEAIKQQLAPSVSLHEWQADTLPAALPEDDLLVAIGTKALKTLLQRNLQQPMLASFLPRRSYEETQQSFTHNGNISAVYLDQSMALQLRLIKQLAPHTTTIGSVFGPSSQADSARLYSAAYEQDLELHTVALNPDDNPIAVLQPIIEQSDLFLAIPDQSAFNRASAKWSLFIALRARKALIGFSEKYVDAGALAAVYSTPEQIGRQTAEAVDNYLENGIFPAPAHPRYFTVKVNDNTARLIGWPIPNAEQLTRQLQEWMQ